MSDPPVKEYSLQDHLPNVRLGKHWIPVISVPAQAVIEDTSWPEFVCRMQMAILYTRPYGLIISITFLGTTGATGRFNSARAHVTPTSWLLTMHSVTSTSSGLSWESVRLMAAAWRWINLMVRLLALHASSIARLYKEHPYIGEWRSWFVPLQLSDNLPAGLPMLHDQGSGQDTAVLDPWVWTSMELILMTEVIFLISTDCWRSMVMRKLLYGSSFQHDALGLSFNFVSIFKQLALHHSLSPASSW